MLRAPGTFNHTPEATGGQAIAVACLANGGRALTLAEIRMRLDGYDIHEIPDFPGDNGLNRPQFDSQTKRVPTPRR